MLPYTSLLQHVLCAQKENPLRCTICRHHLGRHSASHQGIGMQLERVKEEQVCELQSPFIASALLCLMSICIESWGIIENCIVQSR
jgi:hypothetical protein